MNVMMFDTKNSLVIKEIKNIEEMKNKVVYRVFLEIKDQITADT